MRLPLKVILSTSDIPLSDSGIRSGGLGFAGAFLSTVIVRADVPLLTLPATLVASTEIECFPSERLDTSTDQSPLLSALVDPIEIVLFLNSFILEFGAALPVNESVFSDVMSSMLERPVSLFVARFSSDGASGTDASIMILRDLDAVLTLPALSVAFEVIEWGPSFKTEDVILHAPSSPDLVTPSDIAPERNISTEAKGSAVPVKVGVVSDVKLSVVSTPVSLSVSISGTEGDLTDESIVTLIGDEALLEFPALSVPRAVMMWSPDGNLDDLISHFPLELASVEPMSVFPALYSLTSELASAVPVNVGVVNEVMLSESDSPRSLDALISGDSGAVMLVSTVIERPFEATL